ncbi:MAG: hypothetical protein QXO54_00130 [Candidatus Methanomethylicaceae archaeon]|nr:hypothetical protein [Candidatus Verstraetearchaeota archaeon]
MMGQSLRTLGLPKSFGARMAVRFSLDGVERAEFSKTLVIGDELTRFKMIMELVVRGFEGGDTPFIIDMKGRYSGLIDYVPSIRVYKAGRHITFNPLKETFQGYSKEFAVIFGDLYGLSRDERTFLAKALEGVYRDGDLNPTLEGVFEKLLQMEAEAQPKDCYKIECLKNVLSELEMGPSGSIFKGKEKGVTAPMILDLSTLMPKERALMMASSLARVKACRASFLVVDGLDWSMLSDLGGFMAVFRERIGDLCREGMSAYIGADCLQHAPLWGTAYIFCGPIWHEEVRWIRGLLDGEGFENFRYLEEGTGLVFTWKRAPFYLRYRNSEFRLVDDEEIDEHMRALGEEVEFADSVGEKGTRVLERLFRDRASLFYAKEFLRLVCEGRVPVEAVSSQKNAMLRNVVRILKRYFMIVEYMDGSGNKWYRLTRVGEKALSEMEGGRNEGKTCNR